MYSGKHSKGATSDYRLSPNPASRSTTPLRNDDKLNQTQHDLMVKVGQLEKEIKARKEAEERYKDALIKMDRLKLALQDRGDQQETEKQEKESAEERCKSLQLTIDKLEEYLRRKSSLDYQRVGKTDSDGVTKSLVDVLSMENDLKDKSKQLQRANMSRRRYRLRCKELEQKLSDSGVEVDDDWRSDEEDIAEELDF